MTSSRSTLTEKHSLLLSSASLTLHSVHAGHARRTFSALFLLECLMEILAMGFIVGKHAYLRDAWNYLDFVVVITGVLDFLPSDDSSSNLSSLRALRVMRPLRMVNKFPQLRETVR